jgi:hypothetical protein
MRRTSPPPHCCRSVCVQEDEGGAGKLRCGMQTYEEILFHHCYSSACVQEDEEEQGS